MRKRKDALTFEGAVAAMKHLIGILLSGLLLAGLCACGGETDTPVPPADSLPESATDTSAAVTEAETTLEVESATVTDTASMPESETLPAPETEAPDPNRLDVTALPDGASGFFSRPLNCAGAVVTDPTVGSVFRLTSADITDVGTQGPETNLSLKNLAKSLGQELPDTKEFPYLVLKVRRGEVWSRLFRVYGGESIRTANPKDDGKLLSAYLRDTDDWQYIYFDLSGIEESVNTLFLRFEVAAGKNGEYVDIAELRFLSTEEEAIAVCGRDMYELEAPDDTLRVISYNIWVGGGTNTTVRADILREVIDTYKPDSIGMQEVTLAWKAAFETFVFNDSYAGVGEGRSDSYEACLLYYRVDKYELLDSGTFWLSDTPDVKGSSFAEALYPRICTWAHLRDRTTGFEYVHINTHLDHLGGGKGGNELRGEQTKVLLEFVSKLGDLPLVMTGDFNTNPSNGQGVLHPAYAYITGQESFAATDGTTLTGPFADARIHAETTVPADRTATMTKYYDEGGNPSSPPIDYHFYTAAHLAPLSYDTFIFERDGVPLSDHLALICEYRILTKD